MLLLFSLLFILLPSSSPPSLSSSPFILLHLFLFNRQPTELADVIVSELLGSFGDNELSPECLYGAQHILKPGGISIPKNYVHSFSFSFFFFFFFSFTIISFCLLGVVCCSSVVDEAVERGRRLQDDQEPRDRLCCQVSRYPSACRLYLLSILLCYRFLSLMSIWFYSEALLHL